MSQPYKNPGIIVIVIVLCLILSVCSHSQAAPRVIPDHVLTTPFGQSMHLQSWSRAYDETVNRFRLLSEFNNEAILDTETGLVFARNVQFGGGRMNWRDAEKACLNAKIGGR